MMTLGIVVALTGSIAMLSLFLFENLTLWSLFLPMPFILIGIALVIPNGSSFGMSHAKNKSNASAVTNFVNKGTSVIALLLIEALPGHKVYYLPLFYLFLGVLMLVLWRT